MDKSDLVGYWKLDEGSGGTAHDSSGNVHHGTLYYTSWETADHWRALRFDGMNSRIVIPDNIALRLTGDITICAWIHKNGPNNDRRWDAILAKSPGVWDFELLTSMAESDQPAFYSPQCEPNEVYGGIPVASREWHHVAVTRRAERVSFFLDGVVTSTATMTGSFTESDGDLLIGHDGNTREFGMRGMICDVLLFRRALADQEIREIAERRSGLSAS